MESLSSERKSIALDILEDVLSAIDRILWIIKNEIAPLKEAIRFFIGELKR